MFAHESRVDVALFEPASNSAFFIGGPEGNWLGRGGSASRPGREMTADSRAARRRAFLQLALELARNGSVAGIASCATDPAAAARQAEVGMMTSTSPSGGSRQVASWWPQVLRDEERSAPAKSQHSRRRSQSIQRRALGEATSRGFIAGLVAMRRSRCKLAA